MPHEVVSAGAERDVKLTHPPEEESISPILCSKNKYPPGDFTPAHEGLDYTRVRRRISNLRRFGLTVLNTAIMLPIVAGCTRGIITDVQATSIQEKPPITQVIDTPPTFLPRTATAKAPATKTEIPPTPAKSPTPRPTRTERPTATVDPMNEIKNWGTNWIEKFFIPYENQQALRDKGAIFFLDRPFTEWGELDITGPGQVYAACNGKRTKDAIKGEFLTRVYVDRMHFGRNICAYASATEEEIKEYIKKMDPTANPEKIQQRLNGFINASRAMSVLMPDEGTYLDGYLSVGLIALKGNPASMDNWTWRLFGVSNEDNSQTTFIRNLNIPAH